MFSAIPAQAEDIRVSCGILENGMEWCLTDREHVDIILIKGPAGGERITVTCATGEWESRGPNTQEFVQSLVNSYCN